jgi:hypothetical protein
MKNKVRAFFIPAALVTLAALTTCSTAKPVPGAQKSALLVVSFGTSYNESRANNHRSY